MTTFQKLKHEARRAEQRSDWARAIELYRRALDTDEDMADLSLYNRIGDLYLRLGQNEAAVECYERAVERYADNGMHTSAIALCNKILRIAPGRASVYRRLGRLHARTGLVADGRGNILAYTRQALQEGLRGEAVAAVDEFAEITGDEEVRLRFADQLEEMGDPHTAAEQLRAVLRRRTEDGHDTGDLRERLAALEPEAETETAAGAGAGAEAGAAGESPRGAVPGSLELEPPVDLAALVAGCLDAAGENEGFTAGRPEPAPTAPRGDDGLDGVRRELGRFRRRLADSLDEAEPTVRYDLGVELMTIGLLEEAIEEFRIAVADGGLVEAANARIGECIALRDSGAGFDLPRPRPRRADARPAAAGATAEPDDAEPASEPADVRAAAAGEQPAGVGGPPAAGGGEPAPEPPGEVAEEDELQGHFFRARLAQYRIRRAEERHMTDHAAQLDLGTAYVEMGLHQEALRELGVALSGPRPTSGRAARTLRRLALSPDVTPELALEILQRLSSHGATTAETLAEQLAAAWGPDHPLAEELVKARGSAWGDAEELPALEELFPAMVEAGADGEAASDPESEDSPDVPATDRAHAAEPEREDEGGMKDADGEPEAAERLHASFTRLEEAGRTREALGVLERLLELQPDDATLHHQRTELALMVDDAARLASAWADFGACLRRLGADGRARAAYGRLLDLEPDHEVAKRAIADIDAAEVERERQQRLAHRQNGGAGAKAGGDAGAAEEEPHRPEDESEEAGADEAGEAGASGEAAGAPTEEDLAELHALIESLEGEEEGEAVPVDATSREADGDGAGSDDEDATARSQYELGLAFRQMGMWDEAARELRPALDRLDDRLGVLEALGECLVKAGRPGQAIELLEGNLRTEDDAGQVEALYFFGLALQVEGRVEEARGVFERVEAVRPGFRDAAERLSELSL